MAKRLQPRAIPSRTHASARLPPRMICRGDAMLPSGRILNSISEPVFPRPRCPARCVTPSGVVAASKSNAAPPPMSSARSSRSPVMSFGRFVDRVSGPSRLRAASDPPP